MSQSCAETPDGVLTPKLSRRDALKLAAGAGCAVASIGIPTRALAFRKSPLDAAPNGSLSELLRLVPASVLRLGQLDYADYARQSTALGFRGHPNSERDARARLEALQGLPISASGDFTSPEWKFGFGFDFWSVEEMLEVRGEEISLTILRGRFDSAALSEAWKTTGYEPRQLNGAIYYSVRDDWDYTFDDPLAAHHGGRFNNLALLDSTTLVASATRSGAEAVLRVRSGEEPAAAESSIFSTLTASLPTDTVAASVLDGGWLHPTFDSALIENNLNFPLGMRADSEDQIALQLSEASRMPAVALVLAGSTAGASSVYRSGSQPEDVTSARSIAIAILNDSERIAEAREAASDRLQSQAPIGTRYAHRLYADLFASATVEIVPGQPALLIEMTPSPGIPSTISRELLLEQNLTFLFWTADPFDG